jgi:hypothetical protein
MAFALTKREQTDRDAAVARLQTAQASMEDARGVAEAAIELAIAAYNDEIALYNAALEDAAMFRDDLVSRLEDEFDSRSETWRNGDKGDDARTFLDDWRGLEFVELDLHPDITVNDDEAEHAEALEQAPTRMECE